MSEKSWRKKALSSSVTLPSTASTRPAASTQINGLTSTSVASEAMNTSHSFDPPATWNHDPGGEGIEHVDRPPGSIAIRMMSRRAPGTCSMSMPPDSENIAMISRADRSIRKAR